MPRSLLSLFAVLFSLRYITGCLYPEPAIFSGTTNVLVVEASVTDRNEPQVFRINRSQADPYTGQFGTVAVEQARISVVVDGSETVTAREIKAGTYQLPDGFRGKVGSSYQLRIDLSDGKHYESTTQKLAAAPPIQAITDQYNARSLPVGQVPQLTAANDLYIETPDPAGISNYYRWDWVLWERQPWCFTCEQGLVYYIQDEAGNVVERCMTNRGVPLSSPPFAAPKFVDYECRGSCWEILRSNQLNVFADAFTDGQTIRGRRVAQIPFYQYYPALVEVRQSALSPAAYAYFKQLDEQSQRTGGLADTPPAAPVGNIRNLANDRENVVGFFTASGVSTFRYWLDRKNVTGELPATPGSTDRPTLFYYLNLRAAYPEPISGIRGRPPLAPCTPSDTRTPIKPDGWRD